MLDENYNRNDIEFNGRLDFCNSLLRDDFSLDVKTILPLGYEKGHPFPYNNFVYLVEFDPKPSSMSLQKQHGTHEVPPDTSKLVLRLSNALAIENEGFNNECRTENEVAMLHLARQAFANAQLQDLLPRVFAWNSSSAGQQGWIIMEHMLGERLINAFPVMNIKDQQLILDQIAEILHCLQQYQLPDSVRAYGGVAFDHMGNVVSTKMLTIDGGPFSTYDAYTQQMIQSKLHRAGQFPRLDGWRNRAIRGQLKKFVDIELPQLMNQVTLRAKTLVHGDLVIDNLLYDSNTMRLTAIFDFDFAHVTTVADEFYRSLGKGIGLFQDPREGPDVVPLYEAILTEFPDPLPAANDHVNWPAAKAWDDALRKRNMYRPSTIPGMIALSTIYWLEWQIVPFKIVNPVVISNSTEEQLAKRKTDAENSLDQFLQEHGY